MAAFDVRSLDVPIVRAGMGGVARHELAAAVSEAGGLGTIGGVRAPIADELAAARRRTGRPIAVNLLLPFVGPGDAGAAAQADVVVTAMQERTAKIQRPAQPFLGPQPPTIDGADNLVDSGPLYAGANVGRIEDIRPAAELVRTLAP